MHSTHFIKPPKSHDLPAVTSAPLPAGGPQRPQQWCHASGEEVDEADGAPDASCLFCTAEQRRPRCWGTRVTLPRRSSPTARWSNPHLGPGRHSLLRPGLKRTPAAAGCLLGSTDGECCWVTKFSDTWCKNKECHPAETGCVWRRTLTGGVRWRGAGAGQAGARRRFWWRGNGLWPEASGQCGGTAALWGYIWTRPLPRICLALCGWTWCLEEPADLGHWKD